MKPKKIDLHIEKLVLHGFADGDRYRIAEAVERELARLLAEKGVPQSLAEGGVIDRLDGGEFKVTHGSRPEATGAQVARAVYGGLSR